jgi:hypothetical protein
MKKPILPNVLWVIVDSVRNYHTDADDRGRIEVMDSLAKKGVEFTVAVTSAPSTVMSTSAMMTSVPAIYQSLIYEGFNSKTRSLNTLQSILSQNGYRVMNTIFFPEGRRYLKPMIGDICEDYWPDHLNPNEFWGNDNINEILEALLEDDFPDPYFLYLNYNCRHDPATSQKVEHGLSMLEERGLLENTIVVINSDHGYPDPSRNISYTQMRDLGHDLVMTDDNILVPLIFVLPEVTPKVIAEPVSLLDIAPTILDIIGINHGTLGNDNELGQSLKSLIFEDDLKPKNMIKRVDNRYIAQKNRVSALRDNRYKYVFDIDQNQEFFYDIQSDPLEERNIIEEAHKFEKIEIFRTKFKSDELEIFEHHASFVEQRLSEYIMNEKKDIALVQIGNSTILDLCQNAAKKLDVGIVNVVGRHLTLNMIGQEGSYNLCIVILEGSNPRLHRILLKLAKKVNSERLVMLNENFSEVQAPKNWLITCLLQFRRKLLPMLLKDPKTFFVDSYNALQRLLRVYK